MKCKISYVASLCVLLVSLLSATCNEARACTNLIVGKGASANGSTIVSYSADNYGAYGYLFFFPRGQHKKGEMRALYHYETNNYLGEIPEVEETYTVVGLMNEHQLYEMITLPSLLAFFPTIRLVHANNELKVDS